MALRWASIFHASRGEALKLEGVVVGIEGGGEIPRNRICIISLHIFTMIRFSLSSMVNYDPVFVLYLDQEKANPCLQKMHRLSVQ